MHAFNDEKTKNEIAYIYQDLQVPVIVCIFWFRHTFPKTLGNSI